MSTIASLLSLIDPSAIKPWSEGMESVRREEFGRQRNETGLIELANQKAKQAAEAAVYERIQNDPELAKQLFGGGPVLGSLMQPQGQAGAGPMTQQTVQPGMPPGATQGAPGGQNPRGFAPEGGGPAQSIIGSLGPAGQPQMQAPRNPALEMARTDPRAAMLLQGQIQGAQDRQWKMQEQQLGMGVKVLGYVAQQAQGVTDQASLDTMRTDLQSSGLGKYAAQLPQFYSKEAMEPFIARGSTAKDRAESLYHEAKARNLDMETRMFPELAKRLGLGDEGQAPTGAAAPTTPAPPTGQPAGRAGQPPQESEHTRLIRAEAIRQDVDPDLAVAVATQESYLNPNAVGDGGKAKGYFQLHEGAAKDAKIDPARRHEPALNIQGGVSYLKLKLAQSKGDVDQALKLYNGGGDPQYVANVRRFLPGTTGTTGTTQAPATDPRIAGLETKIAQRTRDAQIASLMKNESLSTRLNDDANRLTAEKNRLIEQRRHQQERTEETPRAVEKETALQPLKIAQQEAGARIQNEAKMNEPIGIQAGDELDLPASTKWKDVPKDRKPMPRPEKGERDALSGLRASVSGVDSLLKKLDDPKIAGMVGTIFTETPAAVNRLLGPWLATLPPEQRAFAAAMAGEIMEIRHRLIGAGQTGIEVAALEPMMPSPADTDPATVRAKLTALREGMLRRHNAKRDDLAGLGFRVPEKLAEPVSKSGLTPAQEALLNKHTR